MVRPQHHIWILLQNTRTVWIVHFSSWQSMSVYVLLTVHGSIDKILTENLQQQKIKYYTFLLHLRGWLQVITVFVWLWVSCLDTMSSFWLVKRKHPKYTSMCFYVFFFFFSHPEPETNTKLPCYIPILKVFTESSVHISFIVRFNI